MKRSKYSKIGKIINILYRNTRRLISLPFRLIRLPFKLILGPVFNSNLRNNHQHKIHVNKRINGLAQQVDQNRTRYNLVMLHNGQISELEEDLSRIRKRLDVRETLSERLESDVNFLSGKLKELISRHNAKIMLEDNDLGHIEAEKLGMQVAREEYDWHREQKAKDKQIQDRMRKDEMNLTYDMHPAIADESID